MHPDLAERIIKERVVDDELYVYRVTKENIWVERKAKVDYGDQSWSDKCERHDPRLKWKHGSKTRKTKDQQHNHLTVWNKWHPSQTKLFEKEKKG